ncbi:glycosyltransferase [Cryobacterium sp. PAMC25264]|uniref:glycosyltransferase n=1 Tax=Cryobacterium sp. PAMC25264 TaxID=2861288 RepID=UPI001C626D8B|nr:glycosyltransferase [Cryobacterium sp. PAMC25264]QYF72853.1 glycosyltransferase [Cryobacterium sp. PAMC25264]
MRVLQSFAGAPSTTNPYLLQLSTHLGPDPHVLGFSWERALMERYDVFHVHWPAALLHGSTSLRSLVKRLLFRALLLRLWLGRRRTALVRTVHDDHGQRVGSRTERALLARLDQRTTLWIRLTPATPIPQAAHVRTIEHGDYREWFGSIDESPAMMGRLLFFGLIRPNKGVAHLIEAFTNLRSGPDGEAVSLRVVGSPTTTAVGAEILLAAGADSRVTVTLGRPGDAELAAEIEQAELVVLPYPDLHGSEASVLALSLARPILVPGTPVARVLQSEVGAGWVFTYAGGLSAATLGDALTGFRSGKTGGGSRPDLSTRAWPLIAAQHRAAYATAVRLVKRETDPVSAPAEPG